MALAYDANRVTRDVDARFMPHGIVHEEAMRVAEELGLPRWWLNEQASVYISGKDDAGKKRCLRLDRAHCLSIAARRDDQIPEVLDAVDLHTADVHLVIDLGDVCTRETGQDAAQLARAQCSAAVAPGGR